MEKDPEIKGEGNSYTTEFRQYDPRLGKWMSLDPLMSQFPWMSPYVAFDNNPVLLTDPMGLSTQGDKKEKKEKKQAEKKEGYIYSVVKKYLKKAKAPEPLSGPLPQTPSTNNDDGTELGMVKIVAKKINKNPKVIKLNAFERFDLWMKSKHFAWEQNFLEKHGQMFVITNGKGGMEGPKVKSQGSGTDIDFVKNLPGRLEGLGKYKGPTIKIITKKDTFKEAYKKAKENIENGEKLINQGKEIYEDSKPKINAVIYTFHKDLDKSGWTSDKGVSQEMTVEEFEKRGGFESNGENKIFQGGPFTPLSFKNQ